MENILFPMKTMRITTGVNELSHLESNAIDVAGEDTGIQSAYAPFTGTVKRIYKNGNTVWIESNEKVRFADGTIDYATANFTHDNDVNNLYVGKILKQGEEFYQEGTNNAKANHIHLEIGKGKFIHPGWFKNKQGNWVINNSYEPWKAFWLKDVIILESHGYPWKKEENKMNREQLIWNYRMIGGYEPSETELKGWLDKDGKKTIDTYENVNETMKQWFQTRNLGFYQYRGSTEKELAKLKKGATDLLKQPEASSFIVAGDLFGTTYYRKK